MISHSTPQLAIHGGAKAKTTPLPARRRHIGREKELLAEVIDSDILFYFLGRKVFDFQEAFAARYGRRHCIACSSGTAAVHIALGALGIPPGSEVIVPAITDMGSLTGLLYQGLVPVFADVEAGTLNIDPESVRGLIGPKTRAILAVHHAGLAADMDALHSAAGGVPVVEDCAQAFLCNYKGQLAGTMSPIAAFSLNHFKHIECGSGGMILTDDDDLRYGASLFLDKCYQREEGIRNPFFLAPNYQMTELQGAVALAQLERLDEIIGKRNRLGTRLSEILADVPGVRPQHVPARGRHAYFLYLFELDYRTLTCSAAEFSAALEAEGVPNKAHLITGGRPVYLYDIFQKRTAFPGTEYPFSPERVYRPGDCPVAEDAFRRWIVMNIYEEFSEVDIDEIGVGIAKVARHFRRNVAVSPSGGSCAMMRGGPIRNLRWWIAGLLFASTIINYIDRQTLSVLAPFLKRDYGWTNTDFATVLIAFRVAYTVMQGAGGRLIDKLGTRRGLSLSVAFYSTVACFTALAGGLNSFRLFRFLLGAGEGPNWPGATKAVSEWFPRKETAWAVALFDSGSSIGGAIAPFLVLYLYKWFGSWRPALVVVGCLGFLWLIVWRRVYHSPEHHPRISDEERREILAGRGSRGEAEDAAPVSWGQLLRYRQTWGIVLGRFLLDPYWFLIADWFAVYLTSKGFDLEHSVLGFWAPFLGADLGNFFGGGLSSYLIARGWPVGKSRRLVLCVFGPSMLVLIGAAYVTNYVVLILLFSWASFAYAACSTMFLSLPADVFHMRAVASVSGLGGTGAGIGTLLSTYLIGRVTDRLSFEPVVIAASLIPCVATCVFVMMVRARRQPDPAGIVVDF